MRLCVHLSMNRSKPTPFIFTMPNKENNQPWFVISQCRGAVVITTQCHLLRVTVITGVAMQLQRCFSVYSECEWMTQPLIKNHLSDDLGNHLRWTFLILTVHLYFLQNKRLNTRTHIKVRDCFATSSQFCSDCGSCQNTWNQLKETQLNLSRVFISFNFFSKMNLIIV